MSACGGLPPCSRSTWSSPIWSRGRRPITPQGWRTAAIFACVIVGMIIEPLPASALVLLGLTAMTANGTPMREVLGGFAEPSVWLVIVAMLIARSMLDSGLARRIALDLHPRRRAQLARHLVRAVDDRRHARLWRALDYRAHRPACCCPSRDASRSCSTRIRARPPAASARFLVAGCIRARPWRARCSSPARRATCSGANLAGKLVNVEVTWASWLVAAIVPGLASCAVVPWVVHRVADALRDPDARGAGLRG